ncbi:MAG: hypothetical protein U5N86_05495 [Planctomycetota bacterium]|nr:hypothetical protein [Planctomycetota bacterium]
MLSERREASVRPVDMGNLDREVSLMFDIYNSAWEKNWGFVPMTREEFEYSAKDFAKIAEPELVLFLLVKGEPVGFSLALPDYNVAFRHMNGRLFPFGFLKFLWHKRHIERIRVLAMGMKKEYRGLGLDSIMYLETFRRGIGAGYTEAELSWVLEDNVEMKRAAEKIGGTLYRTYRIYEKSL